MLEFKDATITIGGKTLVSGLSFIAKDGEITCVTGAEHSGKTTLLRTLMGFQPVGEGFVSVDGELLTVHSAQAFRRLMIYLPQEIQTLCHQLRVPEAPVCEAEEDYVWNSLLPSVAPEERPADLSPEEIFQMAELTIGEDSGKQILIADEPAAHLTPELTGRLVALLQQQAEKGMTVLIASRRPPLLAIAHQIIDLDKFSV